MIAGGVGAIIPAVFGGGPAGADEGECTQTHSVLCHNAGQTQEVRLACSAHMAGT